MFNNKSLMNNINNNRSRAARARGFAALFAMLLVSSVLGVAATVPSTPVHAQSFSGLGFLPGGSFSDVQAVNADGTVVVGYGVATTGANEAFRWTQAGGMAGLGFLTGLTGSEAFGVNADGTVVVGQGGVFGCCGIPQEAFRWTQAGGMAGLGFLTGGISSGAQGVNADGTVVVGNSDTTGTPTEAFRWTQAGGMAGLGFLTGGNFSSARSVNAGGTVVVGFSNATGSPREAFRWTQAGGMAGLGFLTGGTFSDAQAVNADGTVVVGYGDATATGGNAEAFRWTQAGGMAGLGFLTGRTFFSNALGVNANGTVVVGFSDSGPGGVLGPEAFRWTQTDGMQSVQALLAAKGVSTTGWTLSHALGVSADGQVIVGIGRDPNGKNQGWIARLGPPTVPFFAFNAKLEIDLDRKPKEDRFELQAHFTLSSNAPGINPVTDPVTLQIGTFTTTIPPGSFKKHEGENEGGVFTFHGVIDGVRLEALIKRTGTLRYAFFAEAKGADLTGTKNPVQVSLTIGGDSGTTSVNAAISGTASVKAAMSR
jgi:probable HAF family extracellular repeat protein